MKKIFIIAGEPSGDIHGSILMKNIKAILPDTEFFGIGGDLMTSEGLESIVPMKSISVTGFWEVAKKYSIFRKLLTKCEQELVGREVDCFLPVDYPGFNLKLAVFAKSKNIPVVWYIAPQIWAWGKNRGKSLKDKIDKLLVVFPFEKEFFEKLGVNTVYVGHPLLDNPVFSDDFLRYPQREKRIAILPGSRSQEIERHLPLVEQTIALLKKQLPDYKISLAVSPIHHSGKLADLKLKFPQIEFTNESSELMRRALVGIVKTGTSNLEAALCGMPFVMFYKTSTISYHLSKRLINLPYVSLVNIIGGKVIVPELIQKEATPEKIVNQLKFLLENRELYDRMQKEFQDLRMHMGENGASKNAAKIIIEYLK